VDEAKEKLNKNTRLDKAKDLQDKLAQAQAKLEEVKDSKKHCFLLRHNIMQPRRK
jgi:hypothetical protein